ncbi:hypothetical protein [Alienimonas sp. DA493]|uniref:hypothetical protein n=1 Tax=Alienimonas sp. DA493 TaxID=3373605 RepID=UPI0037553F6D
MQPHLREAGLALLDEWRQHYDEKSRGGGGSDGRRWEPLTAEYAARKAKNGLSPRLGMATGRLRRSFTVAGNRNVVTTTRRTVRVRPGDNVPYARFFDKRRPLRPDRLPRAWADAAARRFFSSLLRGR